ncbi:hypothetical protein Tco_0483219, partial [Tanacetum coccineum]
SFEGRGEYESLFNISLIRRMSPSESNSTSSILGGTKSLAKPDLISSKMKSPPSNGVRKGEDLAMISSEIRVGLPLSKLSENPNTY